MKITAKQKTQLGYILAGGAALVVAYQFWSKTQIKDDLKEGMQKCRRAAHDLLLAQGETTTDSVNMAGDYCGESGKLYGEPP